MSYSRHVLSLYKKILKVGRVWEAKSGIKSDTIKEREYISTEAHRLFRLNKNVST